MFFKVKFYKIYYFKSNNFIHKIIKNHLLPDKMFQKPYSQTSASEKLTDQEHE